MDKDQAITVLKSTLSESINLSVDQKAEMIGFLDSIDFSLMSFSGDEERSGFYAFLGEFELKDCPHKNDSPEYANWIAGWNRATNHPYVIANIDYYRSGGNESE